jgi:hypothetical protein
MFKKLLNTLLNQRQEDRDAQLYQNLIRHEAQIGGTLFGPVPTGHRREFFCLDRHTWVWHEEWTDEAGEYRIMTTRYDIRPAGVVKSQNGQHYQPVYQEEASRLLGAIRLYLKQVNQEIYSRV